jgi:hypothetical protein
MKRNIAIALLALSSLAAAGKAPAQEMAVQATVPFEFTVGGKLLPADTYTITASSRGVVTIQGADKHFAAVTVVSRDNTSVKGDELVFEKYGDKYFLDEVLCPNAAWLNVKIPASKLEKQVRIQEAKYGREPEPVLVAAR